MKKMLSRIALGLLLLTFAAIVICFYIDQFTYAYALIVLLLIIFGAMGQLYRLKNDEYMYAKLNRREEYEDYTR
ncbi:hypothetical protein MHI24_05280 [Paenibacillus sp. FSL K6-1096]|uniref:hypothetical protein n=1 Tax=Paenibacillus sp. FSL K6-1096 TaxID=2921460 RepID=UPI0030EC40A2